jgi:hypothetical protein
MKKTEEEKQNPMVWRARLRFPGKTKPTQEFLFRGPDDCVVASAMAQRLLEQTTSTIIAKAQIVEVQRLSRIWN